MFGRGKMEKIGRILAIAVVAMGMSVPVYAQSATVGNFSDILEIGMSARPLGMGRAFAAFSDSVDSVFMNPAGLTKVTNTNFSTMFSSLMQDVNYSVLAGAWPQKDRGGVLGVGAVVTTVGGIQLTDASGAIGGTTDARTNLFFLSYGMRLDEFYKVMPGLVPTALVPGGDLSRVELGGTLKYFSVDLGTPGGTGSGYDLDLGVIYRYSPGITLGVNGRNVLPQSMGGKITYDTGSVDQLPAEIKAGAKVNLFGLAGEALNESQLPIDLGIDVDIASGSRSVWHYGAEAWLSPALALRVGMDQSLGATGIAQNLAAGIGYKAGDYELHYAFHPFNAIQENATHFFSINFLGASVTKALEKIIPTISLNQGDKTLVEDRRIQVGGTVAGLPDGTIVEINGVNSQVKEGKITPVDVRLRPGKNSITAKAKGPHGEDVSAKSRVLRLVAFKDLNDDLSAKKSIQLAATSGLIEGFPDGTFQPGRELSRAELSAVLIRNEGSPLPTLSAKEKLFKDMKGSHWAARYVSVANEKQLVRGYLDGTFRANNPITKAEAVTVAVRYNRLAGGTTFTGPLAENPFLDVPIRHWASRSISDAQNSGMLEYVNSDFFEPNKAITRAEAVEIISKTVQGKSRIDNLTNWDEGY